MTFNLLGTIDLPFVLPLFSFRLVLPLNSKRLPQLLQPAMSFGFSVGDFIAAGELAFRVYQNVYMVAKNAPEAVKKLRDELAILSGAINILKGEVETPNSLVNNAGEMRKKMVIELIKNVLNTLTELERLSGKYVDMSSEEVSKTRQILARVKWTRDLPSITTLLAKVEHYNSILNLLVTSAGNSSLERIESTNRFMAQQLSELAELLAATSIEPRQTFIAPVTNSNVLDITPVVTIVKERFLQLSLSEKLMKNAECSKPWVLIGLDLWLQAGRWWLIKAQSSLHPFGSQTMEIGVQAYTDLIKAYWIVVDIITEHPQQKFLHGGSQRLEIELLIEVCLLIS
ncbi:hypothetical protein BKA65DRAFT_26170 [Rhexocercosporidium sp. MPI-PUGE-AT-0058]|nr:hypothetical protein BKA65DRAFT_26170 [Rhexocercosporidium sp. MPI-PUGE-AT-0058]